MQLERALPNDWYAAGGRVFFVAGRSCAQRRCHLEERLAQAEREGGARVWLLPCHFDEGGPWAGVKELFRSLAEEIEERRPDLLRKHDYEIAMALPELRAAMEVRNPTLTDTAPMEEKVRNYPADRAYRMVHGLIDLLASWKRESGGGTWILACDSFDHGSHIGRRFFRELMRRRGESLGLVLLAAVEPEAVDENAAQFSPGLVAGLEARALQPDPPEEHDPREAERLARELEAKVGEDVTAIQIHLPELIRLWRRAGSLNRVLKWRCWGLEIYNTLGLYEDALVYGEGTLAEAKRYVAHDHEVHWSIFVKLFMSLAGLQRAVEAERLTEEIANTVMAPGRRGQFYYLLAMLAARYSPARDLAKGEEYLDRGLEEILRSDLPEGELHFQVVFNRNGLAMIRTFQGRFQEALELCREGFLRLEEHLGREKHRLHRSVLLYNMAQVYALLGAFEEAISHYSAAMEMDPNYSEYYNERGSAYLKMERYVDALQDYLRAIELSPPYFEVYANLGQCYRMMGMMEKAVQAYSTSLDLQPGQVAALAGRAQAYEASGRSAEALADYDAVLALHPDHWQSLASRAVLRYEAGRYEESLADLDRAIGVSPTTPDLYHNRAVVFTELGRNAEAIADLLRYLRLNPDADDKPEVEARLRALEPGIQLSA